MAVTNACELVLAYRTSSSLEARSLALQLQDAGVEVRILGDFLEGPYPGMTVGRLPNQELWIAATDVAVARPVVDEWRRLHHPAGSDDRPAKLRFSMRAVLIAMTGAAILAASLRRGPNALSTLYTMFALLLWIAAFSVVLRRWFGSDDSTSEELPVDVQTGERP